MKKILLVLFVIFLSSCGGTWEDDPENWERAYGVKPPSYVKINHSWFWKSAHWTYECQLFFAIDSCSQVEQTFLRENNSDSLVLKTDTTSISSRLTKITDGCKPVWFAPKSLDSYKIWTSENEWDNFVLLKDTLTGELFWTDMQL